MHEVDQAGGHQRPVQRQIEGWWNTGREEAGGNLGYKVNYKGGYFPVPPVDHYADLRGDMVTNLINAGFIGSLHARDALITRARGRKATARALARPLPALTEGDTVGQAIELLRQRRASLALVQDREGRVTGLVSLDDLLARLLHPQEAA